MSALISRSFQSMTPAGEEERPRARWRSAATWLYIRNVKSSMSTLRASSRSPKSLSGLSGSFLSRKMREMLSMTPFSFVAGSMTIIYADPKWDINDQIMQKLGVTARDDSDDDE